MNERKPTPDILTDVLGASPKQPQYLDLASIRSDGGTQMRAALDEATIAEYVDLLGGGFNDFGPFPPIVVYYDGDTHWLADGFHRVEAARKKAKFLKIKMSLPAEVRAGTRRDAVLFAAGANAAHGLRRTSADKARAVDALLRDPEWSQWSNHEIARRCAVDEKLVRRRRPEIEKEALTTALPQSTTGEVSESTTALPQSTTVDPQPIMRRGADGRVTNTANIGRRAAAPAADQAGRASYYDEFPSIVIAAPTRPHYIGLAAWAEMDGTEIRTNARLLNELVLYSAEDQLRIVKALADGTVGSVASAAVELGLRREMIRAELPASAQADLERQMAQPKPEPNPAVVQMAAAAARSARIGDFVRLRQTYLAALDTLKRFGELTGRATLALPAAQALKDLLAVVNEELADLGA